jgi:hypothetical protein
MQCGATQAQFFEQTEFLRRIRLLASSSDARNLDARLLLCGVKQASDAIAPEHNLLFVPLWALVGTEVQEMPSSYITCISIRWIDNGVLLPSLALFLLCVFLPSVASLPISLVSVPDSFSYAKAHPQPQSRQCRVCPDDEWTRWDGAGGKVCVRVPSV